MEAKDMARGEEERGVGWVKKVKGDVAQEGLRGARWKRRARGGRREGQVATGTRGRFWAGELSFVGLLS